VVNDKDFAAGVHFYHGTSALEEALFGLENGDEVALNSGLSQYRE